MCDSLVFALLSAMLGQSHRANLGLSPHMPHKPSRQNTDTLFWQCPSITQIIAIACPEFTAVFGG